MGYATLVQTVGWLEFFTPSAHCFSPPCVQCADIKFQLVGMGDKRADESDHKPASGSSSPPSSSEPATEFEYDEATKTMRVPLSALQGEGHARRTRLVTFTCNKCGTPLGPHLSGNGGQTMEFLSFCIYYIWQLIHSACYVACAGGRTTRAVNPIAWDKGMVYCQCGQCEVWHVLAANNPDIYEEIRYDKDSD